MPIAITGSCFNRWVRSLEPLVAADSTVRMSFGPDGERTLSPATALAYLEFRANKTHVHRDPILVTDPDGSPRPDESRMVATGAVVELGDVDEYESEIRKNIRSIEKLTGITVEYPPA